MAIGSQFNLYAWHSGKRYDQEGKIMVHNGGNIFKSNIGVALNGGLHTNYWINNRTQITLEMQANKYVNNWSVESSILFRPTILKGGFGIKYTL